MDFRLCVSAPFFRPPPSPGLPIMALDLGRRRRRTKCLSLSLAPSSAFCPRCQTPEFPEEIAERREGLEEKRVARVERGGISSLASGGLFPLFWEAQAEASAGFAKAYSWLSTVTVPFGLSPSHVSNIATCLDALTTASCRMLYQRVKSYCARIRWRTRGETEGGGPFRLRRSGRGRRRRRD